jgi:hypothetical protein
MVRRADRHALIVRFPGSTFFSVLTRKLGWGGLARPRRYAAGMLTELRIKNFAIIESAHAAARTRVQRVVG